MQSTHDFHSQNPNRILPCMLSQVPHVKSQKPDFMHFHMPAKHLKDDAVHP
jgi:hypothetical protein